MYKKYICISITIDNIILEESKTSKILNIVFCTTRILKFDILRVVENVLHLAIVNYYCVQLGEFTIKPPKEPDA